MNQTVAVCLGLKPPERGIAYVLNQIGGAVKRGERRLHGANAAGDVIRPRIPEIIPPLLARDPARKVISVRGGVILDPLPLMIGHYSAGFVVFIISPVGAASVSDSDQSSNRRRARPLGSAARQHGVIVVEKLRGRRRVSRHRSFGSDPRIDFRSGAIERVVGHRRSDSASVRILYGVAI